LREVARVDRTGYAWILTDAAGRTACFDAVICALPARSAGAPLRCCSPKIASFFEATECTGTAIVHLAYKKEQIRRPVLGMGFVVPTSEKNGLIAGSFSSFKYPYRAPDGTTLLRIFVGGARAPELLEAPEEELIARVSGETRKLFDVAGEPILTDVARWPQTMPQYYIGRLDMIKKLRADLERYPGLGVAGNALDGVGVPACIQSGYSAAEDVVRKLSASEFSGLAAHNC
ncbi:MAG: protoporphyrinogen oxidase, partial [Thermoguttaceae bacterium]|nr:protoporphyrinogen oxidase [Thermoguttaceae bacterium]